MGILVVNSDPAALWGEQLNEVTDLTLAKADDSAVYAGEASAFTLTAENIAGQKLEIDSHAVEFDGATVGITEATSDHLTLSCTFAEEGKATLTATYEGLTASIDVTVENDNIVFVDSTVKAICVANWGSDGEITKEQAAAVTTLFVGEPGEMDLAFYANTEITSFNELEYFTGLTTVEEESFNGCVSLASVTLPSTVTTIGAWAFQSTAITSVEIPSGVTSIGEGAFQTCTALASVTVNATTPPTLGTDALNGTSKDLVIYVPADSVEAYKAATNWSNYASMIQAITE